MSLFTENTWVGILILSVVAFMSRYWIRSNSKYGYTSDVYFHMAYVDLIKKNGFRWKESFDLVALPHINSYPFGFHLILAFLNKFLSLAWLERVVSPFIEVLNVLLLYFIASFVFELAHLESLLAGLIYVFTPAMMSTRIGPRAYNGAPRVFGQFLYLLHICIFMLLVDTDMPLVLKYSLVGISATPILLSSTFGTQVLLFFGLALFIPFPLYSISLVVAYLFGDLITWGKVTMLIKGTFEHSKSYSKVISGTRFVFVKWHMSFLYNYKKLLLFLIKLNFRSFLEYYFLKTKNKLHILIFHLPVFGIALMYVAFNLNPQFINELESKDLIVLVILIASFLVFILTSFYKLLFLGEAERYLEFALPMSCIFIFQMLPSDFWLVKLILLVYGVLSFFFYSNFLKNNYFQKYVTEYKEMSLLVDRLLADLKVGKKYRIVALDWTAFPILYFIQTKRSNNFIKIITTGVCVSLKLLSKNEVAMISNNPYFLSSVDNAKEVINDYEVTHVLSRVSNKMMGELLVTTNIAIGVSVISETESFSLYSIVRQS